MDLLLLALLGLVGVCTAAAGGRPGEQLRLLALVAVAYMAGRLLGSVRNGRLVTSAVMAGGAALAVLLSPDGLAGTPTAGPLGYGNANGALCLLGVAGALVAGTAVPRAVALAAAVPAALLLSVLCLRTGSQAATALSGLLIATALVLLVRPRAARVVPPLAATALVLSVIVTGALAFERVRAVVDAGDGAAALLSSRRVALWSEAAELVRLSPWSGVGADGFSALAPTAVADVDAAWAHSLWWQQAAETGLVGAALLLAVGLVAVLGGHRRTPVEALGSATVAAVLVQASIDYTMHFAVVPTVLALLFGLTVMGPARAGVFAVNR